MVPRFQVKGGRKLVGIRIDCNDIPDLVPALAVIGTAARGVTELVNVPQARLKETDRIRSMATELAKMGARISEVDDGLRIEHSEIQGRSASRIQRSSHDHGAQYCGIDCARQYDHRHGGRSFKNLPRVCARHSESRANMKME